MKLIDVDEIKWEEGAFLDSETGKPLPIIHKIATIEMLRDWQKPANAIAIPEHATNGDVIKALFPNSVKDSNFCGAVITHLNGETQYWRKDWWNAEYKEPSSSENPTSSTTKNDLGVDCIDRDRTLNVLDAEAWAYIDYIKKDIGGNMDSHICMFADNVRERLKELPSVTPIRPKGRWIYDKSFANWICSKCGETPKTMGYVGTGAFMAEHFKYCNHCGAEMEGIEEE